MNLPFKPQDIQLDVRPDGALNLSVKGQHVATLEPDVAAQLSKVQLSCFMRAFPFRWTGNISAHDIEGMQFINTPFNNTPVLIPLP